MIVPFHRRPLWRVRRIVRKMKGRRPALFRLVSSLKTFFEARLPAPRASSRALAVPRRTAPTVERVAYLDRRVHDPTRRALLTALS
ncbi:MAG TPA: hypothetical protein VLT87_04005, partial [Thermoanaerobaculia bacterium]|nr:hypothetical protein [Thermoanaerobaculia bacterium]